MPKSKSGIKSDLTKLDRTEPTRTDYQDAPEITDAQLARAVISRGVRLRGRPKTDVIKVPVSLRLDADIIDAFRSTGPGWQTLMNTTLRSKLKELPNQSRTSKKAKIGAR